MKAKIDSEGNLWINRKTQMKQQICPYLSGEDFGLQCGDWCPLFDEPIITDESMGKRAILRLCSAELILQELEDLRK